MNSHDLNITLTISHIFNIYLTYSMLDKQFPYSTSIYAHSQANVHIDKSLFFMEMIPHMVYVQFCVYTWLINEAPGLLTISPSLHFLRLNLLSICTSQALFSAGVKAAQLSKAHSFLILSCESCHSSLFIPKWQDL